MKSILKKIVEYDSFPTILSAVVIGLLLFISFLFA